MNRTGIRVSALILRKNKILLIHRIRSGEEYWTLPGGGIEEGENEIEALKREVKEETGLNAKKIKEAFRAETFKGGNMHPYYFVETDDHEPVLGGPEKQKNRSDNSYRLVWVTLTDLRKINIPLAEAKEKFFEILGV